MQEKSQVDAGESLVLPTTYLPYLRYIKKLQVGTYLGTNGHLLYGKTHSHTTLKEGIKPIRSSFEARRSQLNFEGFDMVCRANGFIDGFFAFCACIEVHVR